MIQEHNIFIHPRNENQKIWRYIDFTKLIDLLNTHSLYFTRADNFDDIFEGSITKATAELRKAQIAKLIQEGKYNPKNTHEWWQTTNLEAKKEFAINCWHMNDFESAAMWKLYLRSNEGIAIQSSFKRLKESLQETDISILIGIVKYIDYEKDFINYGNSLEPYVRKRKSFEHENELRGVIWQSGYENQSKVNLVDGGIKVQVKLSDLIENIYVSPDSSVWFTELVQDVSQKCGLNFPIINSRLKDFPLF